MKKKKSLWGGLGEEKIEHGKCRSFWQVIVKGHKYSEVDKGQWSLKVNTMNSSKWFPNNKRCTRLDDLKPFIPALYSFASYDLCICMFPPTAEKVYRRWNTYIYISCCCHHATQSDQSDHFFIRFASNCTEFKVTERERSHVSLTHQ